MTEATSEWRMADRDDVEREMRFRDGCGEWKRGEGAALARSLRGGLTEGEVADEMNGWLSGP